jgi:hypothetical protein
MVFSCIVQSLALNPSQWTEPIISTPYSNDVHVFALAPVGLNVGIYALYIIRSRKCDNFFNMVKFVTFFFGKVYFSSLILQKFDIYPLCFIDANQPLNYLNECIYHPILI